MGDHFLELLFGGTTFHDDDHRLGLRKWGLGWEPMAVGLIGVVRKKTICESVPRTKNTRKKKAPRTRGLGLEAADVIFKSDEATNVLRPRYPGG